ncbi:MAG: lipocalin family protein [Gammaproteobacteria bacterium]|nr:lipocalin family protein [Gammaproteobacteria bacterium]
MNKTKSLRLLSVTITAFILTFKLDAQANESNIQKVTTVDTINISRYTGKWYEIARFPMFFERNCASDVIATYSIDSKNPSKIIVNNQCRKLDGNFIKSIGEATPIDKTNSKLEVTFLPNFLRWLPIGKAPYWILKIDQDYQTVLVGNPSHKYLWILSRKPQINDSVYQSYIEEAKRQGYDIAKLRLTTQLKDSD